MSRATRTLSASAPLLLVATWALAAPRLVERSDTMEVYFLADVDRRGETVRVLYQTMPSLAQRAGDPEGWTIDVYEADLHADGRVEQRRLASGQRGFGALLLRRGHDEVLAVPAPGPPGSGPQSLELWSARDGSVRSATVVPTLPRVELGIPNIGPSDDGNLFVVDADAHDDRGEWVGIAWHKLSPTGEVLAEGRFDRGGARVGFTSVFPARGGGIGLTVITSLSRGVKRLETDIENPIERTLAGRTLVAEVHSETRMLLAGPNGATRWVSPALERFFLWKGDLQVPRNLPFEEQMQQVEAQRTLQEELGLAYGARTLRPNPSNTTDSPLVKGTPTGYAMLASKTVRRDRVPPADGPYYLEIGSDGSLRREVYLGGLAERLGARDFEDFLPTADGGFLLVGERDPKGTPDTHLHVTRVDASGEATSTVPLGVSAGTLEAMAGTASAPWLIGHRWSDEHARTLLQVELVDPAAGEPLAAATAAPTAETDRRPPAPATALPPKPAQAPAPPGDGCSCSCEEFVALQQKLEGLRELSNAEKMKLVGDPAYMQQMTCASQCAMSYSRCER